MGKRIISYTLTFALIFSLLSLGLVFGNDEKQQLNNVWNKIDKATNELEKEKKTAQDLLGQIKTLESQMQTTQAEIDALRGKINLTQAKIDAAMANLKELEDLLDEQNESLLARLRAMYMNGGIGVLDVLFGSSSISDFMTNMDRIQLIYESDVEVIESLEEQYRILDTHRQYMADLQAEIIAEKEKEAAKKEALKQNQNQVSAKKSEVEKDIKLLEQFIAEQLKEADRLIEVIIKMQSGGDYIGGKMLWPVPGVRKVTSEFGYRIHPILKTRNMHTGIDIGAPTGTKVIAANAGRVMMAGWNDSYGNLVMIDHGGGIVTLYAHNSALLVKTGDIVMPGDQIAKVGSTGMSTGPHLHFEVRVNGTYVDPRKYV